MEILNLYCTIRNILKYSLKNAGPSGRAGLRRRSAAARLLRSWVRIPPGAWIFVCCECCVLSGRGLCDELITRPEESYRLWCVVVCDLETSRMRRPWHALGSSAIEKKLTKIINKNKFRGFGHFCKNRTGFWDNACDKIGYFLTKIFNKYLDHQWIASLLPK